MEPSQHFRRISVLSMLIVGGCSYGNAEEKYAQAVKCFSSINLNIAANLATNPGVPVERYEDAMETGFAYMERAVGIAEVMGRHPGEVRKEVTSALAEEMSQMGKADPDTIRRRLAESSIESERCLAKASEEGEG